MCTRNCDALGCRWMGNTVYPWWQRGCYWHLSYATASGATKLGSGIIDKLRPRQDSRHFPDDIFKWIFLDENVWISINISLKFILNGSIDNIPALYQTMAWRRSGDKPLSEPMMVSLLTHICVTQPQWVNKAWKWLHSKAMKMIKKVKIRTKVRPKTCTQCAPNKPHLSNILRFMIGARFITNQVKTDTELTKDTPYYSHGRAMIWDDYTSLVVSAMTHLL